jgi:sodium transport system permease protein
MLVASGAVAAAAAASVAHEGLPPAEVLADPARSPLFKRPLWIALGTAANELAVGAVLLLWLAVLKPKRSAVLPLSTPPALSFVGALLVVFGLTPLADLAGRLVDRWVGGEVTASRVITQAAKGAAPLELVVLLLCVSLLPAIVEEAMFRGVITASFAKRSFTSGLLVPSVLFGVFHIEPTQIAGTIVLGFGFGLARMYTGSLVPCMLTHGIYNAAVVLAVRYSETPEDRSFSVVPLLLGAVLFALGVTLLERTRRGAASSRAMAGTRVPPPA